MSPHNNQHAAGGTQTAEIPGMANNLQPKIGDWYQAVNGDKFEIVATEEQESVLEIQHFDGAIEEIDIDSWKEMEVRPIEAPEDWSGSMDIEREDYGVDLELNAPNDDINPLDKLE
jgi:hypothetical protein